MMRRKRVYRALGFIGTALATCVAALVAAIQAVPTGFPPAVLAFPENGGVGTLALTVLVTVVALQPLYRPQSRRILDTMAQVGRSLLFVFLALATLGYYGFPFRLSQASLLSTIACLGVVLPMWFVWLQRRYLAGDDRTLVVGHDPVRIETAIQDAAAPVAGYASSTDIGASTGKRVGTDGGHGDIGADLDEYEHLGGLSRLDEILARSNVGTVVPALPRTDRGEFFGVLDTCHRHGVDVDVPAEHGDSVLLDEDTADGQTGHSTIDLHPWDLQDHLCKRAFDICFASAALLCTAPLLAAVALAVKLDSEGPVFYTQERTALFGDTFRVYKFRTMLPESESASPGADTTRITRLGRLLRRTHIDEIPQLWAVLCGQMSVVGPRAAWTKEETLLLEETRTWQKRWFVKPGLTGLAQINDVSSETPAEKLDCDLTYIRTQSLRVDTKIIVRQLWQVATDTAAIIASRVR